MTQAREPGAKAPATRGKLTPRQQAIRASARKRQRQQRIKKDAILASLGKGATRTQAAVAAGIDRVTLWKWAQIDKAWGEQLDAAEAACVSMVESALFANALKPAGRADRIFLLKNRAGYRDVPKEEQAVDDATAANARMFKELLDELSKP